MSATPDVVPDGTPDDASSTPAARVVARNTALRAAAEVLGKLATLALTVVMLRQLGAGAVGDFGVALAISQLYWPIAGFGLDRLMLREIAVDDAAKARMVPQLNAFKLVIGLLCTLVGTAGMALYNPDSDEVVLVTLLLSLGLVATLIGATAQTVFMAKERTQDYFVAALPVKVLGAILGIAALAVGGGIVAVATTNLFAAVMGVALGWWILARRYDQPPATLAGNPRTWWSLARTAGPWGVQEIFGQVMFRVGIIVLYLYAGRQVAGEYRVAYQLLEATLFLPWSIATSILPLIARSKRGVSEHGEPTLEAVTRGSIELVIALMLPIAILLGLCAEPILALLGKDAAPAVEFLPYLAAASVVYGVGHMAGIVGLTHLPGRRTIEVTAIAALFSVAAVALLIPAQEGKGAAIAALATELVLTGLSLGLAVKVAGAEILRSAASVGVVSGLAMAAVVYPLRDHLVFAVIAGGAVYLIVLLALEYRRQGPAWMLARSVLPGSR
ncbi:MAG: oligosaccharide flippase family protein [Solirubrobacteraceae bacterium]|nr:oligosaccharide flippase family protein [Solirubrobacteraceae bacterium]